MKSRAVQLFCLGAVLTVASFAAGDDCDDLRDQFNKLKKEYFSMREEPDSRWKSMDHDHWTMSGMICKYAFTAAKRMQIIIGKMATDAESMLKTMSSTKQTAEDLLRLAMEDGDENLIRDVNVFLSEVTRTWSKTEETDDRRFDILVKALHPIVESLTSVPDSAQVESVISLLKRFYELCEEWEICCNKLKETEFTLKRRNGKFLDDRSISEFTQTAEKLETTQRDMEDIWENLDDQLRPIPLKEVEKVKLGWVNVGTPCLERRVKYKYGVIKRKVNKILSEILKRDDVWYYEHLLRPAIRKEFGDTTSKKWYAEDVKVLFKVLDDAWPKFCS